MAAGGVAHDTDALRIDPQLARASLQELDGGAHVVQRLGESLLAGLREAIADREHAVAPAREIRSPVLVAERPADLPAAAMDGDDRGGRRPRLGQIKVAGKPRTVVRRVFNALA